MIVSNPNESQIHNTSAVRAAIYTGETSKELTKTQDDHTGTKTWGPALDLPSVRSTRQRLMKTGGLNCTSNTLGSKQNCTPLLPRQGLEKTSSSSVLPSHASTATNGFQRNREISIVKENLRLARKIAETKSQLNRHALEKEAKSVMTYKAKQSKMQQEGKATFASKLVENMSKLDYPPRFKQRYIEGATFKSVSKFDQMPAKGQLAVAANFTPSQMKELIQGYRDKSLTDSSVGVGHSRKKSQVRPSNSNFHRSTKNYLKASENGESSLDKSFDRAQQSSVIMNELQPKAAESDINLKNHGLKAVDSIVHIDVSLHGARHPVGLKIAVKGLTDPVELTDKARLTFKGTNETPKVILSDLDRPVSFLVSRWPNCGNRSLDL